MDNFAPLISLIAIVVSTAVAIFTWQKNRVVYEILTEKDGDGDKKVNKLLNTGKYTILHVHQDANNTLRTVYTLGKIEK